MVEHDVSFTLVSLQNPKLLNICLKKEQANNCLNLQAVVVGFFDFNGIQAAEGYRAFYNAAVSFLERDPLREVLFAVVTDRKTAADFSVTRLPSIRLYLWNETVTMVSTCLPLSHFQG